MMVHQLNEMRKALGRSVRESSSPIVKCWDEDPSKTHFWDRETGKAVSNDDPRIDSQVMVECPCPEHDPEGHKAGAYSD